MDTPLEKDEIMIQLLIYGAKDLLMGGEGLTYDDLKLNLQEIGYSVITIQEHQKIWQVIRQAFVYPEGIGGNRKYYLSLESFFYLLDHIEINDLEKSSKNAA
ncbi:MAG: hypothetical protein K0U40_01190 [Betaproteobacteria bacterium]|nr:hypothetical protein [Betaproteobacteria bacterium]